MRNQGWGGFVGENSHQHLVCGCWEPRACLQVAAHLALFSRVLVRVCVPAFPAGTLCQAIWPFFNIYSLAASSVFSIPFWRHFIAWLGSVEATPANFKRILKRGSVAVIVGGIAEMYMQVC